MRIVLQAAAEGKGHELERQLQELQGFIRTAAATGLAVHEVEQGLFKRLLALGYPLPQWFFALLGDGDQGETLTTGEGRVLGRLPHRHRRAYPSIFGPFELERGVYGSREGQRIEQVPLDARLGLPAGKFSYLLQDWDQGLAVESPYQQINGMRQRMLGLEQSVASLEPMTRTMAAAVEGCWAEQSPVPVARAEQVIVLSADGKGVPMRKPAAAPPMAAHQHQKGPKPGHKKMAMVGTIYQIERYRRTPEQVVEALFHEPGAIQDEAAPSRPVPEHKRLRVTLTDPEAAAPRGANAAMFAWLVDEARRRDPGERRRPWGAHGRSALIVGGGEAGLGRGAAGGDPGSAACHEPSMGGSAPVPCAWQRAGAATDGVLSVGAALGDERGGGVFAGSGGSEGGTRQAPTATVDQDLQRLAPPSGPRAGMHWTLPGAHALLRLRCVARNGEWEAFLRYRIRQETARLYPHAELIEHAAWPLPLAA
jgi:hypothetical protein